MFPPHKERAHISYICHCLSLLVHKQLHLAITNGRDWAAKKIIRFLTMNSRINEGGYTLFSSTNVLQFQQREWVLLPGYCYLQHSLMGCASSAAQMKITHHRRSYPQWGICSNELQRKPNTTNLVLNLSRALIKIPCAHPVSLVSSVVERQQTLICMESQNSGFKQVSTLKHEIFQWDGFVT